jgi:HEAT repeat protein
MHSHDDNTELNILAIDGLFELALTSEDEERAWAAIQRLHGVATEEIFTKAVALCHSQDARERRVGVDVLAQLGLPQQAFHEQVMHVLLTLLEAEATPEVLASIGVSLGHRADARAIGALLPFQQHPDPDVRHAVVFGLLGQTDPRAVACLIALSADPEAHVRD